MANVTMQLLLELRQFRQAWDQAAAAAQQGAQKISRSAQQAGGGMDQAGKSATGFAGAIDFLKKRVIGAGLFFAAFYQGLITLRQFIGSAVTELFNLDDALRRVQSITRESDASIARLKDQLLGLAKQGKLFDQSAAAVADSMFTIAQAGFATRDALVIARLAAEGAAVGFTKADTAAGVLVNVLKAYNLPVSKARDVMDILFQTVNTGIITFENLAGGLGKVLSSASALNVPLEEVGAAIATMTLRGFTGAQAMTSLGRMMQTFIRPSQRAKDIAAGLGIELSATTIQSEGFIATLQKMFEAAGGNVTKFSAMFDQIQATRGAVSLFSDDGKLFMAVMQEMGLATAGTGAMALAMEQRAKSLKFQLGVLRSQALAVVTDALQPLMEGLAGVLGHMNSILAGRNAFFNYFADLHALVTALVVVFLFMKREAIAGIFTNIAQAMEGFVTVTRVSVAEVGLLGTAVRGLSALLTTLGPMLVFLAVFAISKFAGQMENADRAMKHIAESTDQFQSKLEGLRGLNLAEDVLRIQEVKLAGDELDSLVGKLVGDFKNAKGAVDDLFGISIPAGVGEALDQVARGIFSLGMSTDSELDKIRSNLKKTVDQWIEEAKLSSDQLGQLAGTFHILEQEAKTSEQAELYRIVAERLGDAKNQAHDTEIFIDRAREASLKFAAATGQALIPAKDVRDAIEQWLTPIKDAKQMMDDILGLTSQQDILLRAQIAPIEEQIARRNQEIADNKVAINARATELGIPLSDVNDSEDAILTKLRDQNTALEDQNTKDGDIVGALKARQDVEGAIDSNLQAQLDKLKLLTGNMPALLSLTDEQQRLLAIAVEHLREGGGPALAAWIESERQAGRVLNEDVLNALLDIISNLKDNKLQLDVEDALNKIGIVDGRINETLQERHVRLKIDMIMDRMAGRQHGVRNFVGGLVKVGEAGEELVRLPRGSDVIPHGSISPALRQQAKQAQSLSASAEVNITTSLLKDFVELKKAVLRAVSEQLDEAAARAGMAKPRFGTWGAGIPRT